MHIKSTKYPKDLMERVYNRLNKLWSIRYKIEAELDEELFGSIGKVGDVFPCPGLLEQLERAAGKEHDGTVITGGGRGGVDKTFSPTGGALKAWSPDDVTNGKRHGGSIRRFGDKKRY